MVLDKKQRSAALEFTKQKDPLEGMVKVEEYVDVGTEKVLESPHVSEGPGRIANSPVPSIYVDDRGEIHRFRVGGTRINMLFSKKDVMRSGYLHNHKTFTFVVKGNVELWLLEQEGTTKTVYGAGTFFQIDPFYPHILHFLEDSLILEYWEGQFQCWYYHPYRRLVQLQNELVANCHEEGISSSIGQWQRLVPLDQGEGGTNSVVSALLWLGTGMVVGAVSATGMLWYLAHLSKRK
ncbi:hypothetical protein FisN_15Hh092 [Fistulifera solaris]|uniref:Uncharacterized protein n=1 Tax=Fistulifera solaris TaxID=1519565 RepID=A0A1Z5K9R7_FISSO|nr:hypothetical protein FisN_15Hh092 [Fistulifera solaris]|eukprot:GAX23010.1 hypothetical protein FisN_15Hh092 [Fistulifera solaris]